MRGMFGTAADLEYRNLPFAIVTIIGTSGTVPRSSGRMLVMEDGSFSSTIGGHLVEDEAIMAARDAIAEGKGRRISVDTGKGVFELMIDVVNPVRRVYIAGYGHVGRALSDLLHEVGFAVYLYDLNAISCDYAAECHTGKSWKEVFDGLSLDEYSALIITVHSSEDILSYVDYSRAFYVGYMGSRSKIVPQSGMHAPAGLDIAAETPAEVAVAITAEIMRSYNRTTGLDLSERRRRLIAVSGDGIIFSAVTERLRNSGYDVIAVTHDCIGNSVRITEARDCFKVLDDGKIPVIDDASTIGRLCPEVSVCIGNGGIKGRFTIGIGDDMHAPEDADAVVGTVHGTDLGMVSRHGISKELKAFSEDEAYAVAGGVLEAVDNYFRRSGRMF